MRTGACPPSSKETFFIPSAASFISCLPTLTDPVKVTLRTMGEAIRWVEIFAGSPVTTLRAPAGRPASWAVCASAKLAPGASSAGLMTTLQPAASAAAILRAGSRTGKFQGVKAATTPTGSNRTLNRTPAPRPSMVWP